MHRTASPMALNGRLHEDIRGCFDEKPGMDNFPRSGTDSVNAGPQSQAARDACATQTMSGLMRAVTGTEMGWHDALNTMREKSRGKSSACTMPKGQDCGLPVAAVVVFVGR
jgi:hypothetical protein